MSYNSLPPQNSVFDEAQRVEKPLSKFAINAYNNNLEIAPGSPAFGIKGYLDRIPVDQEDVEFLNSPDELAAFRDQLGEFVKKELRVFVPPDRPETKGVIRELKSKFQDKIGNDSRTIRTYIRDYKAGSKPKTYPRAEFEFRGFDVATDQGKFDLLANSVDGVRSNILVQRQVAGNFVQWSSTAQVQAKARSQAPKLEHRIYLNPKLKDTVQIFSDVVTAVNQEGLSIKGKIFDRISEGLHSGKAKAIRADGIVLYVSKEESDRLLALIGTVYANNRNSFKERRTPRIAQKIKEGIAIGSQPEDADQSLTSHRAEVLGRVIHQVRKDTGLENGAVTSEQQARVMKAFHLAWGAVAKASGIDPNNLAFNA